MSEPTDSGFFAALNAHHKREQEFEANLEGLPIEYQIFTAEALTKLVELERNLKAFRTENANSKDRLKEIVSYVDSLDIWKSKFSTGEPGKESDDDSLYYITNENVSLRLKQSELARGMNHVIQPFMENIVFVPQGANDSFFPDEHPTIGATPSEYTSQEFHQLFKRDAIESDFASQVPRFYKDGKLYLVGKPKNVFHDHPGSVINKVYFEYSF